MNPRKKILYIHHGAGIGGAPLSLLSIIENLDRDTYEPKVVFLTDSEVVDLFKSRNINVRVVRLENFLFLHMDPAWYKIYNPLSFIKAVFKQAFEVRKIAAKILKEENPDLLHLNSLFLFTWAVVSKRLNIPTIIHVRESLAKGYFGIRRKVISRIIENNCDRIIAISKHNLNRLAIIQKNTTVIYNAVDFDEFNRLKIYPNLIKKNEGEVTVLYLGGQIKYKGFHQAVDCLKYLNCNIKVIFAGHYKFSKELKWRNPVKYYYLKKLYNSPNATVIGISLQIPALLNNCDILIFPSTKPHFARPVLEASVMGKPVLVSDIDGNEEMVTNGQNGIMFKNKSVSDLAEKINTLAENKKYREELGNNAFETAAGLYNSEYNVKQVLDVYCSIITEQSKTKI